MLTRFMNTQQLTWDMNSSRWKHRWRVQVDVSEIVLRYFSLIINSSRVGHRKTRHWSCGILTSTTGSGTNGSVCHSAYNPCITPSPPRSPLLSFSIAAISTALFLFKVAALTFPIFIACAPSFTTLPEDLNQFSADLSDMTECRGKTGSPRKFPICVRGWITSSWWRCRSSAYLY